VRRLIESTHVSLGGEIGSVGTWGLPYLDEDHHAYANELLHAADALLLGRKTYEGLSAAYMAMDSSPFVDRMNAIPKFVASTTLRATTWNSTVIQGDVVDFVGELKRRPGGTIVKYGNGPLDRVLIEHQLVDEFHLLLTPVAVGVGRHLFEDVPGAPALRLIEATRFRSDVLLLRYSPIGVA
jgi:dihydrofolate reductase